MTTDVALKALENYKLGRNNVTDILTVSYSSHDHLGHAHGPNARELEELTIAEDNSLSKLMNGIRNSVPGGLKDVLFVFTADHGVAPTVSYLNQAKIDAEQINESELFGRLNQFLDKTYGKLKNETWVLQMKLFNVYLNHEAIQKEKLAVADLELSVKTFLEKQKGAMFVVTKSEYDKRMLPPGFFGRQIMKTYNPRISGDLIFIPTPYFTDSGDLATHMTGYSYDTSVPIIFAGSRIKAGVHSSPSDPVDIAPTLSFLLGIVHPPLSEGRVLSEIF